MTPAKRAAVLQCAALLSACVSPAGDGDREPPALAVTAPARAARLDEQAVVVTGRASDAGSGLAAVTVNGAEAEVAADGRFRAELALEGGVSLLEVVARDGAGNQARDVRAVLSGPRSQESAIAAGLMARIGPRGYALVAEAVGAALAASDLGAAAPGALMSVPGCFAVELVGLQHGAIDVALEPRAGGVGVAVAVRDLVVDLRVELGGLCDLEGSSAPARLRADALWLRGLARVAVAGGRVTPDLGGLVADFDGFDLDTALVPGAAVDLLVDAAPAELAGALGGAVGGLAADAIGDALGELDAVEWTTAIQGLGLTVRLAPAALVAGVDGLAVTSSVELRFEGIGPVEHAAGGGPGSPPALDGDSAVRLAVADEVANLALAALWTGGFLDRSVVLPEDSAARTRLGLDRLELALALPPMVRSRDGSARIVIGDALITAYDAAGAAVMRLAASAVADLALSGGPGAHIALMPDQAQLWLTPLVDDNDNDNDDGDGGASGAIELPEPLRLVALDQVNRFLDDSLASLPVPDLEGTAQVSGLAAVPGYLVLDADLVAP